MSSLTVSVITVSLNAAAHIERAITSVVNQERDNIEYIVIDGGSTDGTLAIMDGYRDRIQQVLSEPDEGLYDAMNKGLALAGGEVIYFLNADDYLADPGVLADVMQRFEDSSETGVVYGQLHWDLGGKLVRSVQPERVDREGLARRTVLHQSMFTRRALFEQVGGFATDLRVVSDYDWIVRAWLGTDMQWVYLDRDIAVMDTGGLSWNKPFEWERLRVMTRYFSPLEILRYRVLPVTVCITSCNQEQYLAEAIDSVLAQTRPADEVLIIDDASTDGSRELIRSCANRHGLKTIRS